MTGVQTCALPISAELRNFRKNDPTKVNNNDKPREKVGQSSNNSMGS